MADDAAMDVESRMPPEPTATEGPSANEGPSEPPVSPDPPQERGTSPQEPPKPKDIERAESVEGEVGKNRVLVKVMLLDGLHCLLNCTRKVKAESLIEYIHSHIDTEEKDFFSLYFFVNNQKIFLDPEKTVVHQLPPILRQTQPWIIYYGVKFYHPDPSKLKVDQSRYLYTLQLCNDIRNNRILVDYETAKRLTALMMQATLGDYEEEDHKPGYTADFEDFHLIPKDSRKNDYEAQIMQYHKAKAGYTPAQAEGEFCEVARGLRRYGYHMFGIQDDQSDTYLVANGYPGIKIFQESEEIHHFQWPNIVKISYKRRKFRIKFHPVDSEGEPNREVIEQLKYYCGKQPAAKRVWKNAVEQHTFFRLHVPDPPNRINHLLRRGSRFRYSGRTLRQTMDGQARKQQHDFQRSHSARVQKTSYENYAPGYVPARESFRRQGGVRGSGAARKPQNQPPTRQIFVEREDPESQRWVQVDAPPTNPEVDVSRIEQQRVQVNFSVQDGLPQDRFKAVLRKSGGSMEVLTTEDDTAEPSYKLSAIDQDSQAIMTSVSLRVDPEEGEESGGHGNVTVVFDSNTLPSVNLNADTSTSTTVIESSGRTVSSGGVTHSYQYTSTSVEYTSTSVDKDAARDYSQEAIQVELLMKKEGELLQEVLNASTAEGNTEVED
ncbi:Band 4.1-like protein 2 [Geodia barretti]|uniref:Band 4.1-like protein 2 n=2 Tax=Geodia barretti TaxID=519541 RepID=A0AA35S436_GEOBA|nr:Band 4.1-like protein 2 [Geodia barretti]CAI8021796.1 Band 4.1-like protein 2 [Geodia barretti]CAI8021800.1 Band 4.1-like protein 2 [Geodia barretti]CAI8021801.1 Band 4.1-like protein 2 [Geodia barretti]